MCCYDVQWHLWVWQARSCSNVSRETRALGSLGAIQASEIALKAAGRPTGCDKSLMCEQSPQIHWKRGCSKSGLHQTQLMDWRFAKLTVSTDCLISIECLMCGATLHKRKLNTLAISKTALAAPLTALIPSVICYKGGKASHVDTASRKPY